MAKSNDQKLDNTPQMKPVIDKMSATLLRFSKLSILTSIATGIGKIIIGIVTKSIFMGISGFFDFGIGLALFCSFRGMKVANTMKEQYKYYRSVGIILFISGLIFMASSVNLIFAPSTIKYPESVAFAIAAFFFAQIVINFRGLFLAKKSKILLLQSVLLTNLASSITGLVLVQTAILSVVHNGEISFASGFCGLIFGCCATLIGVFMFVRAALQIRKLDSLPENK